MNLSMATKSVIYSDGGESPITSRSSSSVSFVVTGFGPFRNVSENPTMLLVKHLLEYLQEHAPDLHVTTTRILETSAEAARTELEDLYRQFDRRDSTTNTTCVVFLHLGVNVFGTNFQLEQCAYNDASFRIPDERNYQPKHACIISTVTLGSHLSTALPLHTLCEDMNHQRRCDDDAGSRSTAQVVLSKDPGRFVCNYTYYTSLNHCQARNRTLDNIDDDCNTTRYYALFLHVPPMEVASQETQLQVVVQLMEAIDRQLSES